MMVLEGHVLAVDPGRDKTGVAVLTKTAQLVMMDIVPTVSIQKELEALLDRYPTVSYMVCGNGTNHKAVGTIATHVAEEQRKGFTFVNEKHTTEEARRRYFEVHPPKGWRKLVPKGMLYPPVPVDDITAWIIGERWLVTNKE